MQVAHHVTDGTKAPVPRMSWNQCPANAISVFEYVGWNPSPTPDASQLPVSEQRGVPPASNNNNNNMDRDILNLNLGTFNTI